MKSNTGMTGHVVLGVSTNIIDSIKTIQVYQKTGDSMKGCHYEKYKKKVKGYKLKDGDIDEKVYENGGDSK